ncbi:MAG: type II and III secretion system protein family protein [Rhodothalassiaceae bacterium]
MNAIRTIVACLALALVMSFGTAPSRAATETLHTNGESLTLEVSKGVLLRLDAPASDIFIANPAIADVQVKSPRLIYVFGVAPGETTLYAIGANDRPVYSAKLVVTSNLSQLTELYEQLLPQARIKVQLVNGMALLNGVAPTAGMAEAAERYAKSVLGVEIVNHVRVVQPTQVNLRVKFAEVSRSTLKQLGVNWESLFDIGDASIGLFTGRDVVQQVLDPVTGLPINEFIRAPDADSILFNGTTSNVSLNAVLDALETEGLVSVLAEPNLTAVSGQTATFLAGGEFPVPVPQDVGQIGIQFKEFGVRLAFTPIVESADKISLRVAPEVSQLSSVGSVQVQGISVPSLSTRRVETTVEIGSGQSFAIAGLLQNELGQDVRKLPILGDLPIIGALFRSDAFRNNETELVVVTTPYIVRPVDARRIVAPTDGETAPSDLDRYLRNRTITYAPRTLEAPGAGREGPTLVGRAGFRLK